MSSIDSARRFPSTSPVVVVIPGVEQARPTRPPTAAFIVVEPAIDANETRRPWIAVEANPFGPTHWAVVAGLNSCVVHLGGQRAGRDGRPRIPGCHRCPSRAVHGLRRRWTYVSDSPASARPPGGDEEVGVIRPRWRCLLVENRSVPRKKRARSSERYWSGATEKRDIAAGWDGRRRGRRRPGWQRLEDGGATSSRAPHLR